MEYIFYRNVLTLILENNVISTRKRNVLETVENLNTFQVTELRKFKYKILSID